LGQEWSGTTLVEDIEALEYPLYFIHFETYSSPVPLFKGQSPGSVVPFQWSCHKIEFAGAKPQHFSWLHGVDFPLSTDPTVEFARSLALLLGDKGTVLVWSSYEQTIVSSVQEYLQSFAPHRDWLQHLLHRQFNAENGRVVDMMRIAERGYFHPKMKGKLSVKAVLPAVLSADESDLGVLVHINGKPVLLSSDDPYSELGKHVEACLGEAVTNGSEAIIAYENMHRANREHKGFEATTTALLSYCELDTIAMVTIYNYWLKIIKHDQVQ
jgi:hypothetical protein